jgi:hypothetical protein
MDAWQPLIFFDGEDETALKAKFVELSAKHKGIYNAYEVAQYVFRDLKEPEVRALQAAQYWGKDLAVLEAIDQAIALGPSDVDTSEAQLKRRLLQLADTHHASVRDRVAALRVIAEMQGNIRKAVDKTVTYPDGVKPRGLPTFNFFVDPKASNKPEPEIEEDED